MSSRNIEKAIHHALALKEKGVAEPTILAVFPEERTYIQAVFGFVGALKTKREELDPDIETFEKLLDVLPELPAEEAPSAQPAPAYTPHTVSHSESNLSMILWVLGVAVILGIIVVVRAWM